jgi:hypothetical protein
MSGLNFIAIQESIEDYVKSEFPGYEVFDNDVASDDYIIKLGGKVKPYIVLRWGGLRNSMTNGSFAGARHDEYYSTVDVAVVAQNSRQSRIALNVIIDKLIGWKPQDSTPMSLEGGMDVIGVPDYDGKPNVYVASQRLKYNVNTTDIGTPITAIN